MKITKRQLQQIIQEELSQVIMEGNFYYDGPMKSSDFGNLQGPDQSVLKRKLKVGVDKVKGGVDKAGKNITKAIAPFFDKKPAEQPLQKKQTLQKKQRTSRADFEPVYVKGDPDMTPEELMAQDVGNPFPKKMYTK